MSQLSLGGAEKGSGRASCDLAALLEVVRLVEEDGLELEDVPQHLGSSVSTLELPRTQAAKRAHSRSLSQGGAANAAPHIATSLPSSCRLITGGPCFSCGVTEAPQWRRPDPGTMLLCNRCGIHYMRYRKLPGPKKDLNTGSQSGKASPPDSPKASQPIKRKASSLPGDNDSEDGYVSASQTSTASTGAHQLSTSAPTSDVMLLYRTHARRQTSSSILHGRPPVSGQPSSGPSTSGQAAGAGQLGGTNSAPGVPVPHPPQRRWSTGPILQSIPTPIALCAGPQMQGPLDITQLQQFLQIAQTMPTSCPQQSGMQQQQHGQAAGGQTASASAPSTNAASNPHPMARLHSVPVTMVHGGHPQAVPHGYVGAVAIVHAPHGTWLPPPGAHVAAWSDPAMRPPLMRHSAPVKHSVPIPVPGAAARTATPDAPCYLPRRVSKGPPTGSSPVTNATTHSMPQQASALK